MKVFNNYKKISKENNLYIFKFFLFIVFHPCEKNDNNANVNIIQSYDTNIIKLSEQKFIDFIDRLNTFK